MLNEMQILTVGQFFAYLKEKHGSLFALCFFSMNKHVENITTVLYLYIKQDLCSNFVKK